MLDARARADRGATTSAPPIRRSPARALSGGNQQKIVVAREMARDFKVLLAAQPTRGVDVGAIEFIHARLREARDQGKAVLLVSADLAEVLALSDRVAVMYGGRIVALLPRSDASAGDARPLHDRRGARSVSAPDPTLTPVGDAPLAPSAARDERSSVAPRADRGGGAPAARRAARSPPSSATC